MQSSCWYSMLNWWISFYVMFNVAFQHEGRTQCSPMVYTFLMHHCTPTYLLTLYFDTFGCCWENLINITVYGWGISPRSALIIIGTQSWTPHNLLYTQAWAALEHYKLRQPPMHIYWSCNKSGETYDCMMSDSGISLWEGLNYSRVLDSVLFWIYLTDGDSVGLIGLTEFHGIAN